MHNDSKEIAAIDEKMGLESKEAAVIWQDFLVFLKSHISPNPIENMPVYEATILKMLSALIDKNYFFVNHIFSEGYFDGEHPKMYLLHFMVFSQAYNVAVFARSWC